MGTLKLLLPLSFALVAGCTVAPLPYPDQPDAVAPDAAQPDAAVEDAPAGDATPDAGPDAEPPSCTVAGRWTVTADGSKDAKTGLLWHAPAGVTPGYAPNACATSRHPTVAELLAIVVGPGSCSPTLDRVGFPSAVHVTDVFASDGCVNMETGTAKAACSQPAGFPLYAMCVSP